MTGKHVILLLLALLLAACASAIPKEIRQGAQENFTLNEIREEPGRFIGEKVLWGGRILSSEIRQEGTIFEVLKLPLNNQDRPRDVDQSEGRFLVISPDYLDTAIYDQGREITVVGDIGEVRTRPLGEITYTYPVVKAQKVHLWEKRTETTTRHHYYPSHLYGPPYWRYPYWW